MRSLSPSRTLTWTLTVSPDFIAGRSANCPFSTSSMSPMFLLLLQAGEHQTRAQKYTPQRTAANDPQFHGGPNNALLPAALFDQLAEDLALLVVQLRVGKQFRPALQSPRHGRSLAQSPDLGV